MIARMRGIRSRARGAGGASPRRAVILYAAAWLVAAAVAVGLIFAIFGGDGDDTVNVPPVRETKLGDALGQSRCVLRTAAPGAHLNPAVDGPAGGRPARPGFYDKPVPTGELTAAVRRGIVVIQFRPGLADDVLDALKQLQEAVPEGTIVAPNNTGMHFELAVVAYRRLLGCPRATDRALDAVQLFRGRFLGSGPARS
jgi:hypothetical protein